jgi:hypothetical protein
MMERGASVVTDTLDGGLAGQPSIRKGSVNLRMSVEPSLPVRTAVATP